jgi:hypothetical protein
MLPYYAPLSKCSSCIIFNRNRVWHSQTMGHAGFLKVKVISPFYLALHAFT